MAEKKGTEKDCIILLWQIENFSYFSPEIHSYAIDSPVFYPHNLNQGGLSLRLIPSIEDEKSLTLKLIARRKDFDHAVNFEWAFLDGKGSPLVVGILWYRVLKTNESLFIPNCPRLEEICVNRRSEFLPHDTLTVQLRIWKSCGDFRNAECISALSRIEIKVYSFVWPVKEFSDIKLHEKVVPPAIVHCDQENFYTPTSLRWALSLTGKSIEDSSVDFEITADKVKRKYPITVKLSVLDSNDQKAIKCTKHNYTLSAGRAVCAVPKFLSRKELLDEKSNCLRNDVLTLLCEMVFVRRSVPESIERFHIEPSVKGVAKRSVSFCSNREHVSSPVGVYRLENSTSAFRDDFLSLFRDQTLTDFELCSGGICIPVHKAVLSARSPVFRAMFSNNMKESCSHSLDVPDLDVHTLNRLLTFLYTCRVESDLLWEDAAKLYYAADKYHVLSLKQQCSTLLLSQVSVSNISDILTLADRHQDKELASLLHDFVLCHFDEIMDSVEWGNFIEKGPHLPAKAMHQLYKMKLQPPYKSRSSILRSKNVKCFNSKIISSWINCSEE